MNTPWKEAVELLGNQCPFAEKDMVTRAFLLCWIANKSAVEVLGERPAVKAELHSALTVITTCFGVLDRAKQSRPRLLVDLLLTCILPNASSEAIDAAFEFWTKGLPDSLIKRLGVRQSAFVSLCFQHVYGTDKTIQTHTIACSPLATILPSDECSALIQTLNGWKNKHLPLGICVKFVH